MVKCSLPIGRIFSSQIWDLYVRFSHFSQFAASFFMLLDLSGCPDELLNMEFAPGFMQWGEGNCCLEWLLPLNTQAHVSISTSICSYSSPPLRRSWFLLENDRVRTFRWEWRNSMIVPSWVPGTAPQTKQLPHNVKQPVPTIF